MSSPKPWSLLPAEHRSGPLADTCRRGLGISPTAQKRRFIEMAGRPQVSEWSRCRNRDPAAPQRSAGGELLSLPSEPPEPGQEKLSLVWAGAQPMSRVQGWLKRSGVRFLDGCGNPPPAGGMPLSILPRIDCKDPCHSVPRSSRPRRQNPDRSLGATAVYGSQKGLRPEDVVPLDRRWISRQDRRPRLRERPGRLPGQALQAIGLRQSFLLRRGPSPGDRNVMDAFLGRSSPADPTSSYRRRMLDVQTLQGKAVPTESLPTRALPVSLLPALQVAWRRMGERT